MRLLTFLLFSFSFSLFAQEQLGVVTDNYLPVNQISLNPASMVDQKPWLSINVAGIHGFVRNNMIYIPDSRIKLLQRQNDFAYETPNRNGKGFLKASALGPSLTMNWGEHAFGLHTAVRGFANINKIPAVLGRIIEDGSTDNVDDGTYELRNGRVKAMAWGEVGLSYGRIIYKRNRIMINGAATINRITGIMQTSMILKDAEVDVVNGEGTLRNMDGKYSYVDPKWGAGKGWGLNAGVTYKKMPLKTIVDDYYPHSKKSGCKNPDYIYKIGVSLLDLGYIRFKKGAQTAALSDTASVDDLEDANPAVLGVEGNKFTAILPSAISAQIDYHIKEDYGFYVNALIVQKLSAQRTFGVERSNVLAVTPRFESSWFSASMPLSMSNYTTPQLGLYFRFGPLAIGTDHLSPFIIKKDIRAADLYVYLNIPIKKSPECRDHSARDNGKWFCPVW